jgi:hypothetical protein
VGFETLYPSFQQHQYLAVLHVHPCRLNPQGNFFTFRTLAPKALKQVIGPAKIVTGENQVRAYI